MDDIDLTGIAPVRWPEVRRRVALLSEYLTIDTPTAEATAGCRSFLTRVGGAQEMHIRRRNAGGVTLMAPFKGGQSPPSCARTVRAGARRAEWATAIRRQGHAAGHRLRAGRP